MTSLPRLYHVFLSHNHADQPTVADLARRLAVAGLHPWFAATHLIPGEPWQEAMEAALTASETVAVFVGPQGMGPWHNEEMRVAIEDAVHNGKRVIPVLLPGADPERISPFLKRRTWVDFRPDLGDDAAFQLLLAGVRGETPFEAAGIFGVAWRKRHDFYRHISLPPNYIPRPELLAEVRERLLAGTGGLALTSAIQIKQADVLHGMGGIGKSVLARALCDDPDVQAAFPDGILWATLGQTPDLTARLREWIETLGGIVGQTAPTLDQLRNTLAEALRDKACLLIVDDAWQKAHLEPFCAGGPACRLLITTRDAALAEGLDAGVYPVPVMAPDQAVALLEEWAQGSLAEAKAEVKAKIVRRLGCLPLAVRLAGAQLRQKDPVEWLTSFDVHKLKILKNRRVETLHDSLEATFALSLDALEPADRRLYVALAIFKEDEPIPVVAIAKLWTALDNRDANQTNELLDDLADRALLARNQTDEDAITFHDLLRDFITAKLGEEGRITAHRTLLDAYRQTRRGDRWHTALGDGYLYDHLAYHLDQIADHDATAQAELHGLFANQAWMYARVPQSDYSYHGYLEDLSIAWHRVYEAARCQIDAYQEPSALADCIRCALIQTSIKSLASNYDPGLIARAVETGVWPPVRALSMVARMADPERRVQTYSALLETNQLQSQLRAEVQQAALAAAMEVVPLDSRVLALSLLATHSTGHTRASGVRLAMGLALAVGDERKRVHALAAVIPLLADPLHVAVLVDAAMAIRDERLRARILMDLVERLSGSLQQRAQTEGLIAARSIREETSRADALVAWAPHLPTALFPDALKAVFAIADQEDCARALAAHVPRLPADLVEHVLTEVLLRKPLTTYTEVLIKLASHLTGNRKSEMLDLCLTLISGISREPDHSIMLASLSPHLTSEVRSKAVEARLISILADVSQTANVLALEALGPFLRDEQRFRSLSCALAIKDAECRAQMILALAPTLTGEARNSALEAGISAVRIIENQAKREHIILGLAQRLTGDWSEHHLMVALTALGEKAQGKLLAMIAPDLSDNLLNHSLETTWATCSTSLRITTFSALTRYLTSDMLEWTLKAALVISDRDAQQSALSRNRDWRKWSHSVVKVADLIHRAYLIDIENKGQVDEWKRRVEAQSFTLQSALLEALAIRDEWTRASALSYFMWGHESDLSKQVMTAAEAIRDGKIRACLLASLSVRVTGKRSMLRAVRQAMIAHLKENLITKKRDVLLEFCSMTVLFTPPILSPTTLAAIAGHIIEICQEWEWL